MNLHDRYLQGLPLDEFLQRYGTESHRTRWKWSHDAVTLDVAQQELLATFRREIHVLVLAGAWCGDCAEQCPIWDHFARIAPGIKIRYLDRDDHSDVQQVLQINGGNRVPVVVFFSEDGFEVARRGERTLAKYRQLVKELSGEGCSTGLVQAGDPLRKAIIADWLREFEFVQSVLRLSPRLRSKYGD